MAFGPDEKIAQVLTIKDYQAAPYLVLATKNGLVKKTRLTEYDSPRSGGLIAVNLREGDELVGAELVSDADDILMVSRKGQSLRFTASDDQIRPMGRATSGVTGMRFRGDDELLAMRVVPSDAEDAEVFVVFQSGMAKRTAVDQYRVQGRGGLGVKVAKASDKGGDLVGALVVGQQDEVMVVMSSGKVVRSRVDEVRMTGRDTSGVRFADPGKKEHIVAVARTHAEEEEAAEQVADAAAEQAAGARAAATSGEDEQ